MSENGKKFSIKAVIDRIGMPTLIISAFWVFCLILGPMYNIPTAVSISDTLRRFGMNGLLVLAMVPSIQSGTGPNFALPVGVSCGLLGVVCSISLGFEGIAWILMAMLLGIVFAVILGYGYGRMMNAVKGSEMTIATYTGFSITAFMSLIWLMVPFGSSKMQWFLGEGLRETIQLDAVGGAQILNNFLSFRIAGVFIPTGLLLFFALFCILLWLFFKTKTGSAISAGGLNPKFAQASGLNINKTRVIANVISTVLGAIGIVVYAQSYGFAQLYLAPLYMGFIAVASVLIGGATASRAKVSHVILGTLVYQGIMTTALPLANNIFVGTDLSVMIQMMLQNGIILYALTQVKGGNR